MDAAKLVLARQAAAAILGVAAEDVSVRVRKKLGRKCHFSDDEIRQAVAAAPSIKAAARALPLAEAALHKHVRRLRLRPPTLQSAIRKGVAVVVGEKARPARKFD